MSISLGKFLSTEEQRQRMCKWSFAFVMLLGPASGLVHAEDTLTPVVIYDRERGELSVGTGAPKREYMVNAIKSASPSRLYATLEYGERVECFECIPLLADKLLSSEQPDTREIAAWWLRRRAFGFGAIMQKMQDVVQNDSNPERRARAAAALGEFLDPHGAAVLQGVAKGDGEASVRVAAVRALGRLNTIKGSAGVSAAISDSDASVRLAGLEQVTKLSFFREAAPVLQAIADDDANVRRTAAQLAGELRLPAAIEPLLGVLMTDESVQVRQAAAIALGRIGGGDAVSALGDAKGLERDESVQQAIAIALQMKPRN
jgi:HEAT repeat protein